MKNLDIVIVGVGGQGTLLASKILGRLALDAGLNVKVSEVHGMAQRGGSVITHVRMGEEAVYAPLVSIGAADYVVAFEELEGARSAAYLKQDGVMVVNTQRIWPMPVITGAADYPDEPLENVQKTHTVIAIDALEIALDAGNAKAVNLALLGALAKKLPFTREAWEQAIMTCVKPKTVEVNLKAFNAGYAKQA